jgi:uncharacterized coiled-coil protein SlyX
MPIFPRNGDQAQQIATLQSTVASQEQQITTQEQQLASVLARLAALESN